MKAQRLSIAVAQMAVCVTLGGGCREPCDCSQQATAQSTAAADPAKKGPNIGDTKVEGSATMSAAELYALAAQLQAYGRSAKSPLALTLAAQLVKRVQVKETERAKETEQEPGAKADTALEQAKKDKPAKLDTTALLDEARTLAGADAEFIAIVTREESVGESRSPSGKYAMIGEIPFHRDSVMAFATDVYRQKFLAGRRAFVVVAGDGDTDLDLYVYDEYANLVASDTDRTDDCVASWYPRWSGQYVIKVRNLGRVYNRYFIASNDL